MYLLYFLKVEAMATYLPHFLLPRSEPNQAPVLFIFQNPYATFGSLLNLSYPITHIKPFDLMDLVPFNMDPHQRL